MTQKQEVLNETPPAKVRAALISHLFKMTSRN